VTRHLFSWTLKELVIREILAAVLDGEPSCYVCDAQDVAGCRRGMDLNSPAAEGGLPAVIAGKCRVRCTE